MGGNDEPVIIEYIITFIISFAVVAGLSLLLWRPVANWAVDAFVKRLMKDPYPENIMEMYNVFAKIGFQNVLEADLRGTSGKMLKRPFGSPLQRSPWDKLLLNPVYLSRPPVVESVAIDTQVVLGPKAKRPLYIDLPVVIAGMGYGTGLSINAKVALAKAAQQAGTTTNTGAGPFLPEERKHAQKLIIQYHRGNWGKEEAVLRQADMIEIQLGCGAFGSGPMAYAPEDLSPGLSDYLHLPPGEGLLEEAGLPGNRNPADLAQLVNYLRQLTNGAPIGIKLGATQYLEQELAIMTAAGIDFLTIDGAEAGIHYGPGLSDDVGLPTLPALCRTVKFLKQTGFKDKISVIISGGMITPGQFLKALALGADAVAIGTIALVALTHSQNTKVLPWEPLTELVYDLGKAKRKLNVDQGAKNVANFLESCKQEMIMGMRNLGWTSLKQLSTNDLVALTPEMAVMTGAPLGLFTPGQDKT
jgi:glutamate synthase domain-containing protein 2